jgi:choline dehydrogenase-like flavoprotein
VTVSRVSSLILSHPDYVICGGGAAGLVVAARLSEDPNVTVAILEAGGNGLNDMLIDAPNMFTQLWGKPQYDWIYSTVPQVRKLWYIFVATDLTIFLGGHSRQSSWLGSRQSARW